MRPHAAIVATLFLYACIVFPWSDGAPQRDWGGRWDDCCWVETGWWDTGRFFGPVTLDGMAVSCTGTGESSLWYVSVANEGVADSVALTLVGTVGDAEHVEVHQLAQVEVDPSGTFDQWAGSVGQVATSFDCTYATNLGGADAALAVKVTAVNDETPEGSCGVMGFESGTRWASDGCTCFDTDGDCSN